VKAVAGPFVKARIEFEQKQEAKLKAIEEAQKRQELVREKHKERQKKAIKLQMKTKRGQPIMANLLGVMMEKLEKERK